MWLHLHLQVEVDLLRQQHGEVPVLAVHFAGQCHESNQEESNEDAPGDDLDVGDVDLGMRLVLFEQLGAEPADVGQSEDEGRADDAVNAPLRASLPQERSDTQPGLDVAHFVQAEMRDF